MQSPRADGAGEAPAPDPHPEDLRQGLEGSDGRLSSSESAARPEDDRRALPTFLGLRTRSEADRLWEVDALRGLAIVWMIVFHSVWDWAYFNGSSLGPDARYFSGVIGGTFITLLGISLSLDRDRLRAAGRSLPRRTAQRFALIGGAAVLVSLASWLALPERFIFFGILHLLAVSVVLVALTARFGAVVNALIGVTIMAIGWSGLLSGPAPGPLLSFIGWPAPQATLDWYALAPWAGFAFLGFAIGQVCYPGGRRRFPVPPWHRRTAGLRVMGRHSLPIYLTHQLVLIPLVWALVAVLS